MTAAGQVVQGHCDPRFEAVRDAFQESFDTGYEVGAAVAVTLDGESVVDLWGGYADSEKKRPWQEDTIVNLYSTTKGLTAMCALRLMEEGKLDIDAPVAEYWPEFAQNGKEKIPVRFLLSHRAGLSGVSKKLPSDIYYHWDQMVEALAEQKPWWEPGTEVGYHAITFGFLVGEVVRRISGQSPGTYFRTHFAEPLKLDLHIGVADKDFPRCAEMIAAPVVPPPPDLDESVKEIYKSFTDPTTVTGAAFTPPLLPKYVNTPEYRRAEIPAGNGHGTARSLARLYGALACGGELDGVHVLNPATIEDARQEESFGTDQVLILVKSRFGLGFMLGHEMVPLGPNSGAFGHDGAGGSLSFADPEAKVGYGFVMNQMHEGLMAEGANRLANLLYKQL